MVGINGGWIGPFLPQISRVTNLPIQQAGLVVSALSAGYFVSVLVAGEISQRVSAQKILIASMVLFGAGLVALAAASGLTGLLSGGFLLGLSNGGIDVGANTVIVVLNRDRLASALNYLHVLFGVGALTGPMIVSAAFATHTPYRWIFDAGAFACAAIALRIATIPDLEAHTIAESDGGFIAMASRPLIWAISSVMFLYVGAEAGIGAWLFLYLRSASNLGAALASSGVALYWLGLVCGRAFGGRIGHRIALPLFTTLASILSAMALAILIAAPAIGTAAACAVFLVGFGFGPVFPNMIAIGAARFPNETGRMTSIVVAGAALGGVTVPWIMGQTLAHTGAQASMTAALAVTLLMAIAAMSLSKIDREKLLSSASSQ